MPDIDRQFYLEEIRRAYIQGHIGKEVARQRIEEQFGNTHCAYCGVVCIGKLCAMCKSEYVRRAKQLRYYKGDDVASAITGTPYLSAAPTGYAGDPEHPVYVPRSDHVHGTEHFIHGTEQSYQQGCRCGVCHAYADARIRGRRVRDKTGDELANMDRVEYGKLRSGLIGAGQKLFTEPTGHTPSYECSCKDCLKKLGPFPLEDQVAPLMEASKLSEHEVRVMLWKSWLDLNPELKPVRQDRAAQEKKVALHAARLTTATFSWMLSLVCFFALVIGLVIGSTPLCAMSFTGFMTTFLVSLLLGPPKLPKMGWRDKLGLERGWFGVGQMLATVGVGLLVLLLIAMICGSLYCFAMAAYTAVHGPSNWPF